MTLWNLCTEYIVECVYAARRTRALCTHKLIAGAAAVAATMVLWAANCIRYTNTLNNVRAMYLEHWTRATYKLHSDSLAIYSIL